MNQTKETVTLYSPDGLLCTTTLIATESNLQTFKNMLRLAKIECQLLSDHTADNTPVSNDMSENDSEYWERWETKPVKSWIESIQDMKG